MDEEHSPVSSRRTHRLAAKMSDERYRNRYVESHNRRILAQQMREFRGKMSQAEFGRKIGMSQQVVSRLENPNYHGWTAATFFKVASRLGVAAFMRFVDFPTFLKYTNDLSEEAMQPKPYDQALVDAFAHEQEQATETTATAHSQPEPPVIIDISRGRNGPFSAFPNDNIFNNLGPDRPTAVIV